ncbi:MAG: hypothetical protein M0C28_43520 [Candidatus Moduliflexus flocculans]|nr:hypothetical protein [Candidatus Moduliflexus flocculans]
MDLRGRDLDRLPLRPERIYTTLPDPDLLVLILGLPTLALALKGPIEYARHAPEKPWQRFGP